MINREIIMIGEAFSLNGFSSNKTTSISSCEDLYNQLITNILVNVSEVVHARVDSFAFLHSLIRQIYLIENTTLIHVEIGEGLSFSGEKNNNEIVLDLLYVDSTIIKCELTISSFIIMQSNLIFNLVQSLTRSGMDVDSLLKKFPPALF